MATGYTDFTGNTLDEFPSDWIKPQGEDAEVQADAGAPNGVRFRLMGEGEWGSSITPLWTEASEDVAAASVVETVTQFNFSGGSNSTGIGLLFFGDPDNAHYNSEIIIGCRIDANPWDEPPSTTLAVGQAAFDGMGGTPSSKALTNLTSSDVGWLRMRVNKTSGAVAVWYWLDGDTPKVNTDTPDLTYTANMDGEDGGTTVQSVGLNMINGDTDLVEALDVYYFSYGTDSDPAPLPGGGSSDTPISVSPASGVGVGQSVTLSATNSVVLPVAYAGGVGAGQSVTLALSASLTLPVSTASGVGVGGEIPFQLANEHAAASGVGAGQSVTLRLSAAAVLPLDFASGVGAGQAISLLWTDNRVMPVTYAGGVGAGQSVTLTQGSGVALSVEPASGVVEAQDVGFVYVPPYVLGVAPAQGVGQGGNFKVADNIPTTFLGDLMVVPIGAVFLAGIAHSPDGRRYVCNWPSSLPVVYLAGQALRADGAQCIATGADPSDVFNAGLRYSTIGELRVTTMSSDNYVAGRPVSTDGRLSVTDAS